MAIIQYKVVVSGKYLIESLDEVEARLLDQFDLPIEQLKALLSAKALIIKKNVAPSLASKYQKALRQAGLDARVEPMEEVIEHLDASQCLEDIKSQSATEQAPQPKDPVKPQEIRLAPLGARMGPRSSIQTPPPSVDYSVSDSYDRLSPVKPDSPKPAKIEHIQLNEPGALMAEPTEVSPLVLDLDHLSCDSPPQSDRS